MSPAVPPLAIVSAIATRPPGSADADHGVDLARRDAIGLARDRLRSRDRELRRLHRRLRGGGSARRGLTEGKRSQREGQHVRKLRRRPGGQASGRWRFGDKAETARKSPIFDVTLQRMATKLAPLLCELHSHTTWSDGSLTMRELCDLHGRAGFDVLAITDHTQPEASVREPDFASLPRRAHGRGRAGSPTLRLARDPGPRADCRA